MARPQRSPTSLKPVDRLLEAGPGSSDWSPALSSRTHPASGRSPPASTGSSVSRRDPAFRQRRSSAMARAAQVDERAGRLRRCRQEFEDPRHVPADRRRRSWPIISPMIASAAMQRHFRGRVGRRRATPGPPWPSRAPRAPGCASPSTRPSAAASLAAGGRSSLVDREAEGRHDVGLARGPGPRTAASWPRAAQVAPRARSANVEEVLEVSRPDLLHDAALDQPLDAVLAEGLEHPESRFVAAHRHQQRLVGERRRAASRRPSPASDDGGGARRPVTPPGKTASRSARSRSASVEKVPAPLDDGAQRPVPGQRGAAAAGEQPEPVGQPGRDLRRPSACGAARRRARCASGWPSRRAQISTHGRQRLARRARTTGRRRAARCTNSWTAL